MHSAPAQAQFVVSNTDNAGAGSLRQAILDANLQGSTNQTISFASGVSGQTIQLTSALPTIDVGAGTLVIDGTSTAAVVSIDGQDSHRIFFVETGEVTIQTLRLNNGAGSGGDGGAGGGGGGLGAGGGLFVDTGATVRLDDVRFDGNSALGGDGGAGGAIGGGAGGGGGLLGGGGDGNVGGGGGGGLLDSPEVADGAGVLADGGNGGAIQGGNGGGYKNGVATGGTGGPVGGQPSPALPFGGGGGAGPTGLALGVGAGDGGAFGGGGGATGAGEGGDGGFGGGGGGSASGTAGTGGFGAGDGGSGATGGGGGDGLGGAIFVRQGGTLTIVDGGVVADDVNGVQAGTGANGGADGSAGGAALYVMQDVQVTFDLANPSTVFGSISGAGGIRKLGAGTLTLQSADNDYSGGTVVQEGILVGSGAESIQGSVILSATGTELQITEGDLTGKELTAFISGSGVVSKAGAGRVILNPTGGSNSWSGGTQVQSGRLEGSAGAFPDAGDVNVQAAATLVFDEPGAADDFTWGGNLVGDGTFLKTGPGTSRLTGSSSFTGTFEVQEGTLRGNAASLPSATPIVVGDATLAFDQDSDATFSGTLQSAALGDGLLEKAAAGRLTLDQANPSFTGDVDVRAGALVLTEELGSAGSGAQATVSAGTLVVAGNGALFADTTVASGARLEGDASAAGDGVIGDLALFGTVAPGSSVSSLRIDGNAGFDPGSRYELEFDLAGPSADLLDVTGSATVAGNLDIALLGTGGGGTVPILDAAGTYSGCFDSITNQPGFFTFTLDCTSSNTQITLDVDFDDTARFVDFVQTRNQIAVATALDPPPDPDAGPLTDPWDTARFELVKIVDQLPAATDELGGEALTAFTTARLANAQEVGRVVSGRMRQVGGRRVGGAGTVDFLISGSRRAPGTRLGELNGALLASNDPTHALSLAAAGPAFGAIAPGEGRRFGFWVDGYGVLGSLDGNANSASVDWWSAGALLGFDLALGDHGLLGLTGGWSRVDANPDGRSLDGEADVYQGGLYGAWVSERIYLGGLARYAWSDFDTKRTLRFSGTSLDGDARASFDGQEAGGFVELGVVALAPAGWQIEPMAAGHFHWLQREGFDERGSDPEIDALSLEADEETWTSIVSALGVRVHKQFQMDRDLAIQPELWGAWAHEFGDRDRPLDARFKGAAPGEARFRVLGATAARDGGQFGAGWSVSRNDVSLFFYYDGNINADLVAHGLTAGVLVRW